MRPGRLLRQIMRPDQAGAEQERRRARACGDQAHAEALARFNGITADNAREFLEWQETRRRELMKARGER